MSISIQIVLSEKLYLRNPEKTDLGRRMVDHGIRLIDELGFEKFTFKKLALAINSTEASVYRYFENKHRFLVYLVSWYWSWLEYLIDYQTHNLEDPEHRLSVAVKVLANASNYDPDFSHIDENALHRIVVSESSKAFLTKEVDGENEEGLFQGYKSLNAKLAKIIHEVNPAYRHPKALAATAIESSRKQIFFSLHLPSLTELEIKEDDTREIAAFLEQLIKSAIA